MSFLYIPQLCASEHGKKLERRKNVVAHHIMMYGVPRIIISLVFPAGHRLNKLPKEAETLCSEEKHDYFAELRNVSFVSAAATASRQKEVIASSGSGRWVADTAGGEKCAACH